MVAAEARIVHPSALALQAHLLAVVVAVLAAAVCVGVVCRCRAMLSIVIRIVSVVSVAALVASAATSTPIATSVAIAPVTTTTTVVPAISATSTISVIVSIIVMAAASPAPATASIPIIAVIASIIAITAPSIMMVMIIVMVMLRIVSLGMRVGDQGSISILHLSVLASILSFTTSRGIRLVLADLVSDLAACSSTTELPVRFEPVVPVHADHATIEYRPIESVHGKGGLGPRGILDEAEATGLHLDAVEAHDQIDDLPAGREILEQLGLQGEERQVADIQSCRSLETLRVIFLRKTCTKREAKRLMIGWTNEFVVTCTYLSACRNT